MAAPGRGSGRRVGQPDVDGGKGLCLRDLDQGFLAQLEQGDEGDDQHGHAARGIEQLLELDELAALQPPKHDGHVFAYRELLACDGVVLYEFGALDDVAPGGLQFAGIDIRKARLQRLLDVDLGPQVVAAGLGQRVDLVGRELDLFVFCLLYTSPSPRD